ncbi:xylose isomerase-like protein [Boletus reticuloceps]|uniref:Apurinic-apyrimidinic endonuclease 1 n=1 Tax=Boletus reticuloceps TaxID=495285 RepID=A0A8I3A6D8_9AGAM|nr:xylose isomerase-like protein [Boletus reticuloceps]
MVQTRRATQLAAKGEPLTKGDHTSRPFKRAKKEHQPDERPPSAVVTEPNDLEQNSAVAGPTKQPRKARQKKEHAIPKPSDFAPRVSSAWKVGAHVSAAGGVENTIVNAARVGANAFALFVKSQRKWSSPPLTDENVASFKARMNEFGYDPKYILPHGSYLVNLGNPDEAKREKSYDCFLDDLRRCERLGLMFYNFHPGSTVGNATKEESISLIAECLNRVHKDTSSVITVIENMSGAKNIIGSQFTELRDIIEQVDDKSRVGVCLDTCKYLAQYGTTYVSIVATFDEQVGLSYLRGMHLNDSKTPLGSKKDRHENIGLGTLKLPAFLTILSDPRVQNIPLILETPTFEAMEVWECEIKVLNALSEVGATSGASGEEENLAEREDILNDKLGDIRSVIREYRDHKEKVGKKSTSGRNTSKSKARTRKRDATDVEEEDEANSSDDAQSCTEHSE